MYPVSGPIHAEHFTTAVQTQQLLPAKRGLRSRKSNTKTYEANLDNPLSPAGHEGLKGNLSMARRRSIRDVQQTDRCTLLPRPAHDSRVAGTYVVVVSFAQLAESDMQGEEAPR